MRRYPAPFAAFGLLTSVLLCGCGNREVKLVGACRVQVPQAAPTTSSTPPTSSPAPNASAADDPAQAMGRAMGEAMAKMGEGLAKFGQGMMEGLVSTFRLELREDKT